MIAFLPRLRRFACSLTADADLADDLVQDTCVRALAHADQFRNGSKLESWMYRIAQNLWVDRMRAKKVRSLTASLDEIHDVPGCDGRAVTESRLTLAAVRAGIAKLPPDQQVLIALVCVEGLSYREVAEILGVPMGTVMSRLARARRTLHAGLHGELAGQPAPKKGIQNGRPTR